MVQKYRTADEVADMEQEIHELRAQLESTSRSLEIVTAERNRLQVENALLDGKARETLIKATRVEALLQNTAAMIVNGLKEFKEEREQARAVRRHEQETQLAEENRQDPPPAFLRPQRSEPIPPPAPQQRSIGMTEQEGQIARAEQLRGAAERIGDRHDVLPRRPAQVPMPPVVASVSRASLDPRMPGLSIRSAEDDDRDNLRDIASAIERR